MASGVNRQATSTELTGGAGFTYEDTVVAYYLAALLREEHAAGQDGVVASVAVQQSGHGHPMDDIVVEFKDGAGRRVLDLQVKRQLRISAAPTNTDFREIMAAAVATRESCTICPLKPQCCPKAPLRKIPRNIYEDARDVARALSTTAGYEQSRRDRKRVEMLFAHLKRILRLGRLRLRGPYGAQFEFTLAADVFLFQ